MYEAACTYSTRQAHITFYVQAYVPVFSLFSHPDYHFVPTNDGPCINSGTYPDSQGLCHRPGSPALIRTIASLTARIARFAPTRLWPPLPRQFPTRRSPSGDMARRRVSVPSMSLGWGVRTRFLYGDGLGGEKSIALYELVAAGLIGFGTSVELARDVLYAMATTRTFFPRNFSRPQEECTGPLRT